MRLSYYLTENISKRIYFGHPGPTYNTSLENRAIQEIQAKYIGYTIINPNKSGTQSLYKKRGFAAFYDLIDTCAFSVFLPFPDGRWGVGIYEEAYYTHKSGKKVYEINPKTFDIREIADPTSLDYYEIGLTKKGEIKRRIQ